MKMLNPTTQLSDQLLFCIGKIMVDYAYFEHCLSSIIYVLMNINPKAGRIAIRSPSAVDSLEIISDLLNLSGAKIENYKCIKQDTETVQVKRNQIAHGIWLDDNGHIKLRILNASFNPEKGKGKVKRKIKPEIVSCSEVECLALIKDINKLIGMFEKYLDKLTTQRDKIKASGQNDN